MFHLCDKCGAPTRWYDERCPRCGATQAVEIPTSPIALPHFAPSSSQRVETPAEPTFSQELAETRQETPLQTQTNETSQDAPSPTQTDETTQETPTPQTQTDETTQNTPPQTQTNETSQDAPSPTQTDETTQETPPSQTQTDETTQNTPPQRERSRRLIALQRAVAAWRAAFSPETASVTLPRGRVARYALGAVLELFICPPCAILAAYFFTRALFADRRANYHEAMLETEKARRTLAVGLGVFAAFLCAFVFYVQSREIAAPPNAGPASLLFKK